MDNRVRILLFGTGAVGSYYGAMLAKGGAEVSAVCRSDYGVVKSGGIRIKSINSDYHFIPHEVYPKAEDSSGLYDYILLAVKALPEINTPELIGGAVSDNTSIVILQNGINIEEPIVSAFPDNEIISALAFICVTRVDYGLIDHQDYGRIALGTYPSGISDRSVTLADIFRKGGVDVDAVEDVIAARWKKLMWNAPFNPLSVIGGGLDTEKMLSDPLFTSLVRSVMIEVADLSKADSHPIDYNSIEKTISDTLVMRPYKTSMLQDYENRRPMEVEAILGNAVRTGEKYGLDIPRLRTLYSILSLMNKENLKND